MFLFFASDPNSGNRHKFFPNFWRWWKDSFQVARLFPRRMFLKQSRILQVSLSDFIHLHLIIPISAFIFCHYPVDSIFESTPLLSIRLTLNSGELKRTISFLGLFYPSHSFHSPEPFDKHQWKTCLVEARSPRPYPDFSDPSFDWTC